MAMVTSPVGVLPPLHEALPVFQARLASAQMFSEVHQLVVEPLLVEDQRKLVDQVDVARRDHRVLGDVAEQGDLPLDVLRERPVGPAEQDVGLDADGAQLLHAVLGGLGLHLPAVLM